MKSVRNVLSLYVGGTIGMKQNDQGALVPVPNALLELVKSSDLHDPRLAARLNIELKPNEMIFETSDYYVIYQLIEYTPLLDSSNMTSKNWIRIANDIQTYYDAFDGFVVLHGTDTLAYTSSALSFMLDNLDKPVVVTGSQIPIFHIRNDAKSNFLLSLIIAGCYNIPEVCVVFDYKVLRGNRVTKVDASNFHSFVSPNFPPLATAGSIKIKVNPTIIRSFGNSLEKFRVHSKLEDHVAVLRFFPTITAELLKTFLAPPLKGVVIQSYGSGNLPTARKDVMQILEHAIKTDKILIVNVSQCLTATVNEIYETGQTLEKIGIISGKDMTVEAALTKLMFVLALPQLSYQQRVLEIKDNLRGELSVDSNNNRDPAS